MISDIKSIMGVISSAVEPRESILHDSEKKVKWYPVMKCDLYGSVLGVRIDGCWVLETKNGLHSLSDARSFWKLLFLLEQPFNEVRRQLDEFFNSLKVNVDSNNAFPFIEIIRAGFEFGTKHWAEMAFLWYDQLPTEKKRDLMNSLGGFENAKWTSQQLRHKARKELKKLKSQKKSQRMFH